MTTFSRRHAISAGLAGAGSLLVPRQAGARGWPGPEASAADWPQYRGNAEHHTWSRADSPLNPSTVGRMRKLWTAPLGVATGPQPVAPGPIVVGDAVFAGTYATQAHSASSGRLLWSQPASAPVGRAYAYGIVVTTEAPPSGSGRVVARNAATGAALWSAICGPVPSAPAISGSTVVIASRHDVTALSLADGALRWREALPSTGLGSASCPTIAGSAVYVSYGTRIFAFDLASGTSRWAKIFAPDAAASWTHDAFTMAHESGVLYADTRDGRLRALEAATGRTLWSSDSNPYSVHGVAVGPDYLLHRQDGGGQLPRIMAVSKSTKKVLWSHQSVALSTIPVTASGVLFTFAYVLGYMSLTPTFFALNPRTGAVLRSLPVFVPVQDQGQSALAVSGGRVFIASNTTLIALGL